MLQTACKEDHYKDSAVGHIPNPKIFERAPAPSQKPVRIRQPVAPLNSAFSALSGLSWPQKIILPIGLIALVVASLRAPSFLSALLYGLLWTAFMGNALLRLLASGIKAAVTPSYASATDEMMPSYSVIIALYKEAGLVPQVLEAMRALDYPRERLEILFALEADDHATLAAFRAQTLPPQVHIIEVPPGFPRTKPRALNHALTYATGDRIVIYDAEDRPHPLQLREAAAAFADGDDTLACLQAPLRPVGETGFIARQFAAEYAVQFDVFLPALHRLGLPFPLGGTSNHFKADVLKSIGAWDAYNVTEDADLGLRLAQYGYQSGLITRPTYETPPTCTRTWIPQRTRWIKGYLQTLLVHTRLNTRIRARLWLGLVLGVAMSVLAVVSYAPLSAMMLLALLMTSVQAITGPDQGIDMIHIHDLMLFITGNLSVAITLITGARRAGLSLNLMDIVCAPIYGCLQSLAAGFALYQLVTCPYHWDKTEHRPAFEPRTSHKALYEDKSSAYGLEDDYIGHPHHLADNRMG